MVKCGLLAQVVGALEDSESYGSWSGDRSNFHQCEWWFYLLDFVP